MNKVEYRGIEVYIFEDKKKNVIEISKIIVLLKYKFRGISYYRLNNFLYVLFKKFEIRVKNRKNLITN